MWSLVLMEADFSFSSVKCQVWNSNVCVNWMNIFYLLSFWRHWPWSQVCCSQVWSVHVFSYGPRQSRGTCPIKWWIYYVISCIPKIISYEYIYIHAYFKNHANYLNVLCILSCIQNGYKDQLFTRSPWVYVSKDELITL